jgi:hypothetical protein
MDTTSNIQNILSGKSDIGVDVKIDKESAVILGLVIIGAILVGGLLLKLLAKAFNL